MVPARASTISAVPGVEPLHALEDRALCAGDVAEREEAEQRVGVDRRHLVERGEDRLRLGPEQQLAVRVCM